MRADLPIVLLVLFDISLCRGIRETASQFVVELCGAVKAQHRAVALEAAAELLQSPSMTRHAPDLAHAVLQVTEHVACDACIGCANWNIHCVMFCYSAPAIRLLWSGCER